jgi:hypothetical protein
MAFDPKRFSQLARAGDFASWVMQTVDPPATVRAAGYIAPAKNYAGLLQPGHLITRITYTNTSYNVVASFGTHIVLTASATSIDLSDELAGVITNT